MRLIDADALMRKAVEKFYITNYFLHISTMIDEAPTIDAVPVVRCKDCRWFGKIGCAIEVVDETDMPKENDFCSFAERKDDE